MPGVAVALGLLAVPPRVGGTPNPITSQTVMRETFVMADNVRMTDNG